MCHFVVGDKVSPVRTIRFLDGSKHYKGEHLTVTEETVAYYNVCWKDYVKRS